MSDLTQEQIKQLANAKLDQLRGEAQDVACSHAWGSIMPTCALVAAGMAVTAPLGGMAGLMGVVLWGATAASVMVGGIVLSYREGSAIYQGDLTALDKYLPDDDWVSLTNRAEQVKLLADAAIKKPEPPKPEVGAAPAHQEAQTPPAPASGSSSPMAPGENAPGPQQQSEPLATGTLTWADGEHLVLIGLSGSSKSTTLIQCVPAAGLTLYVTLKTDDKCPPTWKAWRLRKFADAAFLAQLDGLCDIIERLVQSGRQHRLIIDEALSILDQSKNAVKALVDKEDKESYKAVPTRFEGLIKLYIRTGRSDGNYLGLVTQSPNGTDLFESAKTMQGLKTVLCAGEASSNRFAFLIAWAQQLYGQWLTASDVEHLRGIQSGFWHFWLEAGQLHGAQTQRSTVELAPCPEFSLSAASKALRSESSQAGQGFATKPELADDPAQADWATAAPWLLKHPGSGLRSALSELTGKDLDGGTLWQDYRDSLAKWLLGQPEQTKAALCNKYMACLPAAMREVARHTPQSTTT